METAKTKRYATIESLEGRTMFSSAEADIVQYYAHLTPGAVGIGTSGVNAAIGGNAQAQFIVARAHSVTPGAPVPSPDPINQF